MAIQTLGRMVERIREEINRGTDYDARIKQAIHDAIEFYKGRRFTFNTRRCITTTTPGIEYYGLPTDFIEMDHLRVEYASDWWDPMEEVGYRWIEEHRTNAQYRSTPEKCGIQNQELRIWLVPDQTYTLMMSFHYHLPEVSTSASDLATNSWTGEAEEMIRCHAKADVWVNYIRGEEATVEAGLAATQETRRYKELKRIANRQQSSGRIVPWE